MLCRHQWFQTQTVVEVAVLAKNMTKERVDILIDKQHLRVVIRDAEDQQEFELDLDLYGEVRRLQQHNQSAKCPDRPRTTVLLLVMAYQSRSRVFWLCSCTFT